VFFVKSVLDTRFVEFVDNHSYQFVTLDLGSSPFGSNFAIKKASDQPFERFPSIVIYIPS
jgi:hypothetical protein